MPFLNFDNRHFSAAEKTAINAAIATLETALQNKLAVLTPEERQQYGSVNEQNKLIINKVKDLRDLQPALGCPDVDWVEFMNDYDTRMYIQGLMIRFEGIQNGLGSAKILHDWDNFHASLIDYDYAKFKASANVVGYPNKVAELSQFFVGRPPGSKQQAPEDDATS